MAVERSNPSALANPGGYSHVVKDGKTVYVAGQVARDREGKPWAWGISALRPSVYLRMCREP